MENVNDIIRHYELTDEQFEEMYDKCKYITFYGCKSVRHPIAVFVGGQTGAGKGGIDVFSEQELMARGERAAILDVDIYRALHPYTTEVLKKYPTLYTNITAKTTGMILKRIMQEAIDKNISFIFEGTLKNTEAFETMKTMPDNFTKYIRVMATSNIESLLTAFERNYQQIQTSGYGRFTNVETHNFTYFGVLNTIKVVESSGENIIVEIFKRGKDMVSPIRVFSSSVSNQLPSEVLIRERILDKKQFIEQRKERARKLINLLQPKDEFEKLQLEKFKEETIYLFVEEV